MKIPILISLLSVFYIKFSVIQNGFCIAVICNNRPEMLKKSLDSLLAARGVIHNGLDKIHISQNSGNKLVKQVIDDLGLSKNHVQNIMPKNVRKENRLALHFNWTFYHIFDNHPECNDLIVIEDDLELSPDFLDYFKLTVSF